ncbi:ABC transporter permease [Spongiimicrobium salis]|uniref:ABC transporter permease n=1 Tax=Spongiimicrobium salis TaxID=1667022 RepID=UPI00374D469D
MFKNYIKIGWRNILKSKAFSAINILGLSAGLSSVMVVLLFLNYELSYDRWDESLNQVYKLSIKKGNDISQATQAPLAQFLAENYPEVEAATSIQSSGDYETQIDANGKTIFQKGVTTVDSLFLKVFPYTLLQGAEEKVLNDPNAVVISIELAQKLFGSINPVGESIKFYNAYTGIVAGVFERPETPTHLDIQVLMRDPYQAQNNSWSNYSFETYIKTQSSIAQDQLEIDINRLYFDARLVQSGLSYPAYLTSETEEKFYTDAVPQLHNYPKYGASNIRTIQGLFILALLLLIAGSINFSNLSVVQAMGRTKEVGVRKVLGSKKSNLILQFMVETTLQCLLSFGLAILVIQLCLPLINTTFGLALDLWGQSYTLRMFGQLLICLLVIILLSGLYPAFFLSKFSVVQVLKGAAAKGKNGMSFRNALIVVQFMVTGFFLITIVVISKQLHFMQERDLGFNKEHLIRLEAPQAVREQGFDQLKNNLEAIAGITHVAKSTQVPGDKFIDSTTTGFLVEGSKQRFASVKISTDYFKALQIKLLEGREFTNAITDQNTTTAIINEAAARRISPESPVGKTIYYEGCDKPMEIIGVVNNFNVMGAETLIRPTVFTIGNEACRYQSGGAILVKINTDDIPSSIAALEEVWEETAPGTPIRYSFLDGDFELLLASYLRLQKVITFFGIIAIVISLIGLLALTAFVTRQRRKEIGIRRVLGAEINAITKLIGKDFLIMVGIASCIAVPAGWWIMKQWLQNFAYQVEIGWFVYFMVSLALVLIAYITVSIQTVRSARVNPAKSLRTE